MYGDKRWVMCARSMRPLGVSEEFMLHRMGAGSSGGYDNHGSGNMEYTYNELGGGGGIDHHWDRDLATNMYGKPSDPLEADEYDLASKTKDS